MYLRVDFDNIMLIFIVVVSDKKRRKKNTKGTKGPLILGDYHDFIFHLVRRS